MNEKCCVFAHTHYSISPHTRVSTEHSGIGVSLTENESVDTIIVYTYREKIGPNFSHSTTSQSVVNNSPVVELWWVWLKLSEARAPSDRAAPHVTHEMSRGGVGVKFAVWLGYEEVAGQTPHLQVEDGL